MRTRRTPESAERMRQIVAMRRARMTQDAIAQKLGISQQRVSQLYRRALAEVPAADVEQHRAEELDLIGAMHAEVLESLHLGLTVFLRGGRADADRLVARKAPLREMEMQATALHVRLLRVAPAADRGSEANASSSVAEESGLFRRIVRDLRRIHSHLARLAYPILDRAPERAA